MVWTSSVSKYSFLLAWRDSSADIVDETAEATVEATMEDADLYMCIVDPVLKHVIDHDVASVQIILFYV